MTAIDRALASLRSWHNWLSQLGIEANIAASACPADERERADGERSETAADRLDRNLFIYTLPPN